MKEVVMKTQALSALMIAGAMVFASGCSGDDTPSDSSSETSGAAASAAPTEGVDPAKVSPKLKKLPVVKKAKGGIRDLELGKCATDAGSQTVKGTITSSAKKSADYLVTVSWTTGAGDVMGRGFAVMQDVAPGDSVDFSITAKIKDGATRCVPGVTYGAIG